MIQNKGVLPLVSQCSSYIAYSIYTIYMNKPVKLINQGSYGCIYYPGIKCNGKKETKQYITKIQEKSTDDVGSGNEIEISNIIKTIPNYKLFFAPVIESCNINIATMNLTDIRKCEPIREAIKEKKTTLISNKIQYLGETTLYASFLKYKKDNKKRFVLHLLEIFDSILTAIDLLIKNKIIHADIKENNIMINPKTQMPILIDFGQSIFLNEKDGSSHPPSFFSNFEYDQLMKYTYYPLDFALLSYILTMPDRSASIKEEGLADFKEKMKIIWFSGKEDPSVQNEMASFLTDKELTEYENKINLYLQTVTSEKTWQALYDELISYSPTWDLYGVFCMYIVFYQEHLSTLPTPNRKTVEEFIEFSKTQVYCLPGERLSISDVKKKCKEIVNDI